MAFERLLRLTKKCPGYVMLSVGIATVTQESFESQYYITRALFGTRSLFAMTERLHGSVPMETLHGSVSMETLHGSVPMETLHGSVPMETLRSLWRHYTGRSLWRHYGPYRDTTRVGPSGVTKKHT